MMKKLFFILTISNFIWSHSFASTCSSVDTNPTIKLNSSFGKLLVDESKNTSQLTEIAKNYNIVEQGLFASGLSTVNVNFDITVNVLAHPSKNKKYCVKPTDIEIFLGFVSPIIYISNELKKDSCEYNQVLFHEQTHHQINKSTLEYYLPMFKEVASAIIKKTPIPEIDDPNKIEDAINFLTETYNQKLSPLVDYIKNEMLKEQQKLDNPENYQYEAEICAKSID